MQSWRTHQEYWTMKMDPEDRTLARLHDTTQDRGPELEAHWSHAPLRAACVLRLALGTLLYYTLLNSRRFAFLCLIQLLHLRARRRRPLHCGTVSRASRHTGLIGSHLASQHSAFLSSHPMSSLAPTHLVYILSYVSCPITTRASTNAPDYDKSLTSCLTYHGSHLSLEPARRSVHCMYMRARFGCWLGNVDPWLVRTVDFLHEKDRSTDYLCFSR